MAYECYESDLILNDEFFFWNIFIKFFDTSGQNAESNESRLCKYDLFLTQSCFSHDWGENLRIIFYIDHIETQEYSIDNLRYRQNSNQFVNAVVEVGLGTQSLQL